MALHLPDIEHAHDITYFVLIVAWESSGVGQSQAAIGRTG